MSTAVLAPPHPVLGCAATLRDALAGVADVQPVFMSTGQKRDALVALSRVEAQVAELKARVLAVSGEVGEETGARDAAAWLAYATCTDTQVTRAESRLAQALESRPLVAAGMREGRVNAGQALVITAAVAALPPELGPELLASAERTLVGYADHHTPRELKRLGGRLLEVLAPAIADEIDGKRLEDEERRAREKQSLKFRDLGDGTTRLWGRLPTTVAQRLKAYLHSLTSPRRRAPGPEVEHVPQQPSRDPSTDPGPFGQPTGEPVRERVPQHQAYAEAFATLLEQLDPDGLPEHGGDATTVIVTMTLDQLRADLATADLLGPDGDETISATQARRLACQAQIIPAVLGGKSEVLDLGRSQRLFTRAQRRALRLRDHTCRAESCTIPATWTEAHHLEPWSHGGPTDLANAISLRLSHESRVVGPVAGEREILGCGCECALWRCRPVDVDAPFGQGLAA